MMKTDRISKALFEILEDSTAPACERVEAARVLRDLDCWNDLPEPKGATFTEEQFELLSEYIYNAIHHILTLDPGEPPSASETFLSEEQRYMMARERAERSGVELRRALNVEKNT